MTQPDLTNLYKTRAAARLKTAGLLLRNNPACQFTTAQEADLARSDIGMMIWSAAIDLGSILLLQERQTEPTGRSPQVSQFITRDLHQQHPRLSLDVGLVNTGPTPQHPAPSRAHPQQVRKGSNSGTAKHCGAQPSATPRKPNRPEIVQLAGKSKGTIRPSVQRRLACALGPHPTREIEHTNPGHWDSTTALGSAEPRSRRRRSTDNPRRTHRRQGLCQRNSTALGRQKRTT